MSFLVSRKCRHMINRQIDGATDMFRHIVCINLCSALAVDFCLGGVKIIVSYAKLIYVKLMNFRVELSCPSVEIFVKLQIIKKQHDLRCEGLRTRTSRGSEAEDGRVLFVCSYAAQLSFNPV